MKPALAVLLGGLVAVGIPLAAWAAIQQLDERQIAPAPFGDLRLVLVYALATIPLAWTLVSPWGRARLAALLGVVCAAVVCVTAHTWMEPLHALVSQEIGPLVHHAARLGIVLVPTLAGCYLTRCLLEREMVRITASGMILGLLVAVLPTFIYAQHLANVLRAESADYLAQRRSWRAWQRWEAAKAIDGFEGDRLEVLAWRRVRVAIGRSATRADTLANATDTASRAEAIHYLLTLDQHDAARQQLALLPPGNEVFDRYRAELARREGRWSDVILALPEPRTTADFDLLAMAYRGQGDWQKAEGLYRDLLKGRPGEAGHWHHQLARHYELSGRPRLALDHYEAALKIDPSSPAAEGIRRLGMSAPTCVLRW